MAGVPQIQVPTAQPEASPTPVETEPQLGAFSGAHLGEGLTKIGAEIYGIGWESYHKAAEAFAQDKETELQKRALILRDQYRKLENFDAVQAHEKVGEELEKARQEVGDTISSKYGKALYMNNSLRNLRFVQESIDQHYEQQEKSFRKLSYDGSQIRRANTLAGVAGNPVYKPEDAEAILQEAHDAAFKNERSRGVPEDAAEEIAKNDTSKVAHSLFKILTNPENPNRIHAQAELDKYEKKGWVDQSIYKDVMGTVKAANTARWARESFVTLTREDGNHDPDPEGMVPHSAVLKLIDAIPQNDPHKGEKSDALEAEYVRQRHFFEQAGYELRSDVNTQRLLSGGSKFKETMDWQKLVRLHGDLATTLDDRASTRNYQAWHRAKLSQHEAGREAYGSVRYYLDALTSEDIQKVSDAQVEALLAKSYHGPGVGPADEERGRAIEYLKKLKSGKIDPVERDFGHIASQALEQAYKGNRQLVRAAMNRAYYFLDDTYKESVRNGSPMSKIELRAALVDEFSKKDGIFGFKMWGRPGESYEPRGAPKEFSVGSEDWRNLPSGTRFRMKNDPVGQYREVP